MSNTILIPESAYPQANSTDDVTARLHSYLAKCPSNHITYSPSSASTDATIPEKGCSHDKVVAQGNYDTCFSCGVYMPKNGSKAFKGKNMSFTAFFPTKTIYETMIRQSHCFKYSQNSEYAQTRFVYVEWILELAEKFQISANTSHLAVYLLDIIMFKNSSFNEKVKLFASICLLISSKATEIDDKIPYIPKLRRYGDSRWTLDDYRQAELQVLDLLDWNPQLSSTVQITEFLLTQGVLFSSDEIDENKRSGETPKSSPKIFGEIKQMPKSQEIYESYHSEVSTTGTLTDGLGTPQSSPMTHIIPGFFKQPSIERQGSTKMGTPIEKKVDEILNHIEGNYVRICNLMIQDIDLIEWEPKLAAAAVIAFFRRINNVFPIWNAELETITRLKFSQFAVCHELLYRKYNSTFNLNLFKFQNNIEIPEQKQTHSSDLNIPLTSPISRDKTPTSHTNAEVNNKPSSSEPNNPPTFTKKIFSDVDLNTVNKPSTDRKSIFTYPIQTKDSRTSVLESYDFLRDQLFCKLNREKEAENISRNTIKNSIFSDKYMPSRFGIKNQENISNNTGGLSYGISNGKVKE